MQNKIALVAMLALAACHPFGSAQDFAAPTPDSSTAAQKVARFEPVAQYLTPTPPPSPQPSPNGRGSIPPRVENTRTPTVTPVAKPIQGSGGIQRTPTQIVSGMPASATAPYKERGYITRVDYIAKTMTVTVFGSSIDHLKILDSLDIGTAQAPRITAGNWAIVERIGSSYRVTGWDLNPMSSTGTAAAAQGLAAPLNFTVQIKGGNLEFNWSPAQGAVDYQIFQNTLAGPTGATLFADVGNATTYTRALNTTANSELITNNPGFETGTLDGWITVTTPGQPTPWNITTASVHSGTYAATATVSGVDGGLSESPHVAIVPSTDYTFSVWYKTSVSSAHGSHETRRIWTDSTDTTISASQMSIKTITAGWTQVTSIATAPSNAAYAYMTTTVSEQDGGASYVTGYVDDFSIIGQTTIIPSTTFFGVRAIGALSGQSSPFTPFQQPTQSPQSIGTPSSPHSVIDNASAMFYSSNYAAAASGYQISPSGISGQLNAASLIASSSTLIGNLNAQYVSGSSGSAFIQKALITTQGDLIAASGNACPARLAVGSATQVLTVDSTCPLGMKWATPSSGSEFFPKSLLTTKGDLIAASGNACPARLAVGSDTQVLTADSACSLGMKWATPAGPADVTSQSLDEATVTITDGAETTIHTTTIGAGALGTTGGLISRGYLDHAITAANYHRVVLKFKLGATTVHTYTSPTLQAAYTQKFEYEWRIFNTAADAQRSRLIIWGVVISTGVTTVVAMDYQTAAVDTTSSQALTITADPDGSTPESIVTKYMAETLMVV